MTLSIHAKDDDKNPKKSENSKPLNIFNYIYSNSKSDAKGEAGAKNKPFHLSQQKNKMKHEQASSFWEKLLSMAAAGVGAAAGSVYVVKSIFVGRGGQSTAVLKREIQRLKALLCTMSKQENMKKIKEVLSKIHILSKRLQK